MERRRRPPGFCTRMNRMDRRVLCVLCRTRPVEPRWRPFCSERCQLQDQARWADGVYQVPGSASSLFPDPHDADDEDDG